MEIWGGGGVGRGGGGGGREGGWEVTPVQTSRRVCVRTSHSPVSLTRSLSLPLSPSHSLRSHTHTRRGTGAKLGAYRRILGIVAGGAPPLHCCASRVSSLHLPASPNPSPRLQPVLGQRPPLSLGPETRNVRRGRCSLPPQAAGSARGMPAGQRGRRAEGLRLTN